MSRNGGMFSEEEVAYLKSLPAVVEATSKRITYANAFKDYCMRRYAQGASPVALFREAGLDPVLVGSKRIERCFARWRRDAARRDMTVTIDGARRGLASAPSSMPDRASVRTSHDADQSAAERVDEQAGGGCSLASSPLWAPKPPHDGTRDSSFTVDPTRRAIVFPATGDGGDADLRDMLIAQQVRRIAELERQVTMLRAMIAGRRAEAASTGMANMADAAVAPGAASQSQSPSTAADPSR